MLKRGISPLIATVLIIGFTVALAAVIMIWGQEFIKGIQQTSEMSTEEKLACTDADLEVKLCRKEKVDGDPNKIADDLVDFLVDNKGRVALADAKLRIVYTTEGGTTDTINGEANKELLVGDITTIIEDFPLSVLTGQESFFSVFITINKAEALPVIEVNNKEVVCEGARAVLEFDKWQKVKEDGEEYLLLKIC